MSKTTSPELNLTQLITRERTAKGLEFKSWFTGLKEVALALIGIFLVDSKEKVRSWMLHVLCASAAS
jgi:hypothetical protein